MLSPSPYPSDDELAELRSALLAAARVAHPDREDVVQEALLRVVREGPGPSALPLRARAFRKLRDASADLYRLRKRKREPQEIQALGPETDVAREDAATRLVELEDLIISIAGPDVLQFARWQSAGMTEREIGEQRGWSPQRAAAARRKLSRKQEALMRGYKDS